MSGQPPARGRPGRKRSTASREAILEAALALVAEDRSGRPTVERIAGRAGVGKQTIYRWWSSRGAIVLDALNERAAQAVRSPDTGTLAGDIEAFLQRTFAGVRAEPVASALRVLMAEAQLDPSFAEAFRAGFLDHRRHAFAALLARAEARGEWHARVAHTTLIDMAFGVLWYRLLAVGTPLDDTLAQELTGLLVQGGDAGHAG